LNQTRPNPGLIASAAGGGLLVVFLFLKWYGAGDESVSGWESFTLLDVVLTLIGLAALAISVGAITGATANVPAAQPAVLKWLGAIALSLTFFFLVELTSGQFEADMKIGGIFSVLSSLAILVGAILAERPQLLAGVGGGAAAPAGPGAAPGSPAAPPAPGAGAAPGAQGSAGAAAPAPQPPAAPPAAPAAPPAPEPPAASPTPEPPAAAPAPEPAAAPAATPAPEPTPPPAPAPPQAAGPPAGWYPDPQGQKRLRYWDGQAWTGQTSPD
jgi:hypothetical protein